MSVLLAVDVGLVVPWAECGALSLSARAGPDPRAESVEQIGNLPRTGGVNRRMAARANPSPRGFAPSPRPHSHGFARLAVTTPNVRRTSEVRRTFPITPTPFAWIRAIRGYDSTGLLRVL